MMLMILMTESPLIAEGPINISTPGYHDIGYYGNHTEFIWVIFNPSNKDSHMELDLKINRENLADIRSCYNFLEIRVGKTVFGIRL